ncbi:PREDICTED: solute carrier family 25 member 43-like [Priapulus caudatus]|uniref:Solute carrier family 25 member 43-like n=1 Tax=Priapulus caudatus TaxID=37621 RepID=A0ABM1E2P6_PRICU|nr:PREDICTED: solute carrier family 25 member 43-like [Priapulus caudatus]
MGKAKKDDRMTFGQNFISGGIAGVTSRTITSPLDVVKILSQVGTKDTRAGFLKTFSNVYTNEGVRAFWKGNGIACIRLFPYSAIQFAAFNQFKLWMVDEHGRLGALSAMAAGSGGGIVATVTTYPTDMVKTRLTAQHSDPTKKKYKGIIDAFRLIAKEEGILAFYKGMSTSIIGVIPFAGGTFMAYEVLDKAWGKPKTEMSPVENFINGCLAASFAQTFSFPFDTIRKKLQAQSKAIAGGGGVDIEFNGMVDAFVQTVKKNGIFGLWRGTTATWLRLHHMPGSCSWASKPARECLYRQRIHNKPDLGQPQARCGPEFHTHRAGRMVQKGEGARPRP